MMHVATEQEWRESTLDALYRYRSNLKEWVNALRSGQYEQGQRSLTNNNNTKYCCLGVACKRYMANHVGNRLMELPGRFIYAKDDELIRERDMLPPPVAKWLGLPQTNPLIGDVSAAYLNDSLGLDFDGIANRIEKYLIRPLTALIDTRERKGAAE